MSKSPEPCSRRTCGPERLVQQEHRAQAGSASTCGCTPGLETRKCSGAVRERLCEHLRWYPDPEKRKCSGAVRDGLCERLRLYPASRQEKMLEGRPRWALRALAVVPGPRKRENARTPSGMGSASACGCTWPPEKRKRLDAVRSRLGERHGSGPARVESLIPLLPCALQSATGAPCGRVEFGGGESPPTELCSQTLAGRVRGGGKP